jgi:hypothetical protein
MIIKVAVLHTINSKRNGWTLPSMLNEEHRNEGFQCEGLTPYWIDRLSAIKNNFKMKGLFVLTVK